MIGRYPVLSQYIIGDPIVNVTSDNCSNGVQWIYHILNDCVYDARGISSEVLGLASILTWMVVSIPQMVKNCRKIEGVEGISLMLILMWTLGDTANLVGAYLTKQLPLQIYTAVYFVLADLILFGQFLYYNLWWKRQFKGYLQYPFPIQDLVLTYMYLIEVDLTLENIDLRQKKKMLITSIFLLVAQYFMWYSSVLLADSVHGYIPISETRSHGSTNGVVPQAVLCIGGIFMLGLHRTIHMLTAVDTDLSLQYTQHSLHIGRTLMAYPTHVFTSVADTVGYAIGIVSSIFYTFSRLGQMWKNYKRKSTEGLSVLIFILAYKRKSTEGLSVLMFILAVIGNLTYGLSILVRSLDGTYVLRHLPWLIGSLGVIFLDSSLLIQFKYYGKTDDFNALANQPVGSLDSEIYVAGAHDRVGSINSS